VINNLKKPNKHKKLSTKMRLVLNLTKSLYFVCLFEYKKMFVNRICNLELDLM